MKSCNIKKTNVYSTTAAFNQRFLFNITFHASYILMFLPYLSELSKTYHKFGFLIDSIERFRADIEPYRPAYISVRGLL